MNDLTLQERLQPSAEPRAGAAGGNARHRRILAGHCQAALEHPRASRSSSRSSPRLVVFSDPAQLSRHGHAPHRAGQEQGRLHRGGLQPGHDPARVLPDAGGDPQERRAGPEGRPEAQAHHPSGFRSSAGGAGHRRQAHACRASAEDKPLDRGCASSRASSRSSSPTFRCNSSGTASSRRSASRRTTRNSPPRCPTRWRISSSRATSRRAWR